MHSRDSGTSSNPNTSTSSNNYYVGSNTDTINVVNDVDECVCDYDIGNRTEVVK
jgi:hypothetical protein